LSSGKLHKSLYYFIERALRKKNGNCKLQIRTCELGGSSVENVLGKTKLWGDNSLGLNVLARNEAELKKVMVEFNRKKIEWVT
jgi:hypothetical protein